jgi:hypothetical protein
MKRFYCSNVFKGIMGGGGVMKISYILKGGPEKLLGKEEGLTKIYHMLRNIFRPTPPALIMTAP